MVGYFPPMRRTVFELSQGLQDSKTSDFNSSYEALVQREELTICQGRVFVSFLCVLSLSSVLGKFMHLSVLRCRLIREEHPCGCKALPLLPYFQHIWCKYIIEDREKFHSLISFYELFLSNIRFKTLKIFLGFFVYFLDIPSLWLTPSVFSRWKVLRWYT